MVEIVIGQMIGYIQDKFDTHYCSVNEPSPRVALLMALSDESDGACLCDISLINELHYRILMYRFVTKIAKNVTWCQKVLSNI